MSVIQRASDFVSCVLLAVEVVYIFIVIHALTMVAVRSKALAIYFFFCNFVFIYFVFHFSYLFVCLFVFFVGLFSFILSIAPLFCIIFIPQLNTQASYSESRFLITFFKSVYLKLRLVYFSVKKFSSTSKLFAFAVGYKTSSI